MRQVTVQAVKGIQRCHVLRQNSRVVLQTEGANFQTLSRFSGVVEPDRATCTDVHAMSEVFGVG